jgi:hypothetical protein
VLNKLRVYLPAYYAALKDRFLKRDAKRDFSFNYRGYVVSWTGWKLAQDNLDVVGQWWAVAAHERPWSGFYASVPGGMGRFNVGGTFDIRQRDGQKRLTIEELSQRKLASYVRRQEGWLRLKKQLDDRPITIFTPSSTVERKRKFMSEIRKAS